MKKSAIQQKLYFLKTAPRRIAKKGNEVRQDEQFTLPAIYYPCSTILGIANAGKLKLLFAHNLPCMYSGIEMIDPKKVQKLLKNRVFEGEITDVLERIKIFEKSIQGTESIVYEILKEQAKINPNKTISETFKEISPYYQGFLRKDQAPILCDLNVLAKDLPDSYRSKFIQLMKEARDKLAERPIINPFSTNEFKYRLRKIKEDVSKNKSLKAKKVMTKLLMEADKLPEKTTSFTRINQLKTVRFLKIILSTSILKDNESLFNLLIDAEKRLKGEKVIAPFSRKAFIYDLAKVIEYLPDKRLKEKMLETAEKLPTSRENVSAYVMKYANEPSEKIIYRLLWPSMASIEHIYPRSCGGVDDISNFGGACTRENSDRKSIDFTEQIKLKPETKYNCQKYVDRLIELAKEGIFDEYNIDIKYIEEFKNTVYEESQGVICLDISKLYE